MPTPRLLGHTRFSILPLALGCNVFGWTLGEAEGQRVLDAFVEGGGTLLDTADVYSRWAPGHVGGESERAIGRWLKQSGKRSQVLLATKVGMDMGEGRSGLRASHITAAVEASLQRLQTDHIDLYQAHKDDGTPPEETLAAFHALVQAGKVRAIGASNFSAARLKASLAASAANGWAAYATLQPEYNLYTRQAYERDLAPTVAETGVGVLPYFALASGFLTGKYRTAADFGQSVRGGSMARYLTPRGLHILDALDRVSAAHGVAPATIALAWLMAQPHIAAPIASATTVAQLHTLLAALEVELHEEELAALHQSAQER